MWGGATFDVAYNFLKRESMGTFRKIAQSHSECVIPNVITRFERSRL